MASIEELKKDIAELELLHAQATRSKVKDILSIQINKLLTEVTSLTAAETASKAGNQGDAIPAPTAKTVTMTPRLYNQELTTYAWDQSEKFMKIYVTMNGVQKLDKDAVTAEFTSRSFRMQANNLDNKNQYVNVGNLHEDIIPEQSYHKVKTDTVLLMLKKKEEKKTWPYLTLREDKKKKEKKPEIDESDPSAGLMNMMKQMYDDGDDEMKRTIAKAWSESREKQRDMPGF